jgi:hypothetical protein
MMNITLNKFEGESNRNDEMTSAKLNKTCEK